MAQAQAGDESGRLGGMQCTICLGDEGNVVQRGCCCRGEMGAVHVQCLIEYAQHVTDNGTDLEWRDRWYTCETCKQVFTGRVLFDLAEALWAHAESDEDRIWAASIYAAVLEEQCDRYTEAEKIQLEVLTTSRRLYGEEGIPTLKATFNLAMTYRNLERYTEAEEMLLDVLATIKRVLSDEHPINGLLNIGLAWVYRSQRKYTQALDIELDVLAACRRARGEEDSNTLIAADSVATTYFEQGRYIEALELQLNVLVTRKRVFGEEHPCTLSSSCDVAETYFQMRKYTKAERHFLDVHMKQRRVFGEAHRCTRWSAGRLSDIRRLRAAKKIQPGCANPAIFSGPDVC